MKYPNKVVIQAGANSGLQVGDELEVFPLDHVWEGDPCSSRHLSAVVDKSKPPVILRVTDNIWSSPSYALLDIVDAGLNNFKIRPGDYVQIHKLVQPETGTARKALARSIKIGDVTPGKLMVENQEIDWVPYLKLQITPILTDPQFDGRFVIYPED